MLFQTHEHPVATCLYLFCFVEVPVVGQEADFPIFAEGFSSIFIQESPERSRIAFEVPAKPVENGGDGRLFSADFIAQGVVDKIPGCPIELFFEALCGISLIRQSGA